jgi:peptidoglycan/LPS O-acetylase OafA/YrhL
LLSKPAVDRHIPGLDGLRAIAIVSVLVAHNFEFSGAGVLGNAAGRAGTAAVHLFFAISGYLITCRLAEDVAAYRATSVLKAFYIRRVYRIFPPLVPYFALLIGGGWLGMLPIRPGEVTAAVLFASNYFQNKSWYTGHFWSLSAEEHFYLLWAPMLALSGLRRSQAWATLIIILTVITRPILLSHGGLSQSRLLEETHLQLDFFGYASLFALWMRVPKFRLVAVRLGNFWVIGAAIILLALTGMRVRNFDLRTFQAFLFGAIVLLLSANPKLWATRALEHPVIAWVGKRSYGIYIWQQIIFIPMTASFSLLCLLLVLRTTAVLAVAQVSYRFLEAPMLRKGHAWSKRILAGNELGESAEAYARAGE